MDLLTAAVIPSNGIGDALLMMIASHQLHLYGYKVTTYHPSLPELKNWFKGHHLENEAPPDLSSFSLIIFENDNGPKYQALKKLREEGKLPNLSIFYPSYLFSKHGPLYPLDRVFDPELSMAENIASAISSILGKATISKDNGLFPPIPLLHRHFQKRIVIHPTSSTSQKNWALSKYLKVAKTLQKEGFEVVFSLSPKEREELLFLKDEGIDMPLFDNLAELAAFLYESGALIGNDSLTGHLASNLAIPTLIIADEEERMRLWRPGWLKGEVITPPDWIPKWMRLKKNHWQNFISSGQVLTAFKGQYLLS